VWKLEVKQNGEAGRERERLRNNIMAASRYLAARERELEQRRKDWEGKRELEEKKLEIRKLEKRIGELEEEIWRLRSGVRIEGNSSLDGNPRATKLEGSGEDTKIIARELAYDEEIWGDFNPIADPNLEGKELNRSEKLAVFRGKMDVFEQRRRKLEEIQRGVRELDQSMPAEGSAQERDMKVKRQNAERQRKKRRKDKVRKEF
jgi:hypothetical protein